MSLPVLGAGALVTLFLLAWREGVTLEPSRGTIRCWSGPFFPVISTRIELADDSIVALMEDGVEVFGERKRNWERTYSSSLGLKLQARLTPDMRHPEDLPPPIHLKVYSTGSARKARVVGEALARELGFEFRSDL